MYGVVVRSFSPGNPKGKRPILRKCAGMYCVSAYICVCVNSGSPLMRTQEANEIALKKLRQERQVAKGEGIKPLTRRVRDGIESKHQNTPEIRRQKEKGGGRVLSYFCIYVWTYVCHFVL